MSQASRDSLYERAARDVVPVLQRLLSFDTQIRDHDDPPRDDQAHQEFVAGYLSELGFEVELFEPPVEEFRHHPMYRPEQSFAGRPVLWARLPGSGEGRSLLFNGHYDTVVADPIADWTRSPWAGEVEDGRVYGRGACDMKGGIAAALTAAGALVACGARLAGDLLFNLVPFEEVNGMGTTATMLRGHRADAAICCEPSELATMVACRGVLLAELSVTGRSAHAEIVQPHHSLGGGVNAIDKLIHVLAQLRVVNDDWRTRPGKQHPLLSTPYMLTTVVRGGAFASNWPAEARATLNLCYLPGEADREGYGGRVKADVERCVADAARMDPWLRENPPELTWLCDFPPQELSPDHPLVTVAGAATRRQGLGEQRLIGFDTWADQVMLLKEGGIPAVCLGPGSVMQAHAVDEFVPVSELELCSRLYVDLALDWCGGGVR